MNCLTQRRNLQQHFCDSQLWIRQIGHHMLSWNHGGSIKRQPWESCTTAEQVVQHKFGTARNRQPMEKAASPKNSICQHRGIRETSPLNTPSPIDPGHGGATVGEFFSSRNATKRKHMCTKRSEFRSWSCPSSMAHRLCRKTNFGVSHLPQITHLSCNYDDPDFFCQASKTALSKS